MKRRTFLRGLTAASTIALAGGAAFAASFADDVVSQLARQGFVNIVVETTWLGRVRIVAERKDGQREIILNPRTGEILRDSWLASGASTASPIIDEVPAKTAINDGASGGDDNSGSGSSDSDSSGSGSSGSGSDGSASDGGSDGGSGSDGGGSDGSGGSGGDDKGGDSAGHGGGSDDSNHGDDDKGNDEGGKGN